MPGWLAATVRWTVAVAVALGAFALLGPLVVEQIGEAVGVGRDQEELPDVGTAVGPPPLAAGRSEAIVDAGASLGAAETLTGGTVDVGPAGVETLLLGFEPLPPDPACLAGVALEVFLHGGVETSVHALPARIDDLGELDDGQPLPANHLLDRTDPGTAYTSGAGGWLRFHIRGPYQLAERAAREGAPVVLAVRLPEDAEGTDAVTFSTVADRPARLRWASIDGCEVDSLDEDDHPADDDPVADEPDDP